KLRNERQPRIPFKVIVEDDHRVLLWPQRTRLAGGMGRPHFDPFRRERISEGLTKQPIIIDDQHRTWHQVGLQVVAGAVTSRVMTKLAPTEVGSSSMVPRIWVTSLREIASPRPVPFRLVVWKGLNTWLRRSGRMPGPVSETARRT